MRGGSERVMKIEKIIIENINSIEKAEISFTEGVLAHEPLFLITGETGSGKSTILDAITLALYDKSPRYENTKNKEKTENGLTTMQSTTNALRKGTNDGKAELWFTVGNEEYIATWQMHRTRNGKYDMTNRRKLELVKGEDRIVVETKIDVVNQIVAEKVGLTYDQFVRSVMLAQGQFNTFLTSEKSKQTEILEMLTGTEVYSKIAEIVGRKKNAAKADEDRAAELYNSLRNNILSEEELAAIHAELAKSEAELKTTQQSAANIEKLERLNGEIEALNTQLVEHQKSYNNTVEENRALQTKRDELKKRIDGQAGNKALSEQMPLIVSLLQGGFSNNPESDDYKESEFSEISMVLAKAESAKNEANVAFEECNSRLEKADLDGLQKQYNEHNDAFAAQENRKRRYLLVKQILNDYLNKNQIIDNKLVELEKLKQHFNICENEFQKTKAAFEVKDSDYQIKKNMVADFMKSLRSKLEDGKPCPLCGSTSHQYHEEKVVDSLFASVEMAWKEARNDFEKAKDSKNKTEGEMRLLNNSVENERNQLQNLESNLKQQCNDKPIYDMNILDKGLNDCELKISAEQSALKEINVKKQAALVIQDELKQLQKRKTDADEAYKLILRKLAYKWKHLNDELLKVDADIVKNTEKANGIKHLEGVVQTNLKTKNDEKQLVESALKDVDKAKVQETLEALGKAVAELQARISLNDQNFNQAQSAKDDLQAKTSQLTLWTQLADAIGTTATNNFRDVAQAYTMRILLDQANYFLHKLSQRYELTCYTNSLAIMVMDKEMGGEMRTASSLSGGETFLVSLALALGLASLNDENLNIDMLFIDEGFGTLDGESLEMAVTALGNMQKFGKKVGIISHVDSLKERIPAQIRVTKRGKAASTITVVGS